MIIFGHVDYFVVLPELVMLPPLAAVIINDDKSPKNI
jgi:hypothetical protein